MAGRNRVPPRHMMDNELAGFHDGPLPHVPRGRGPVPLHALEEELAIRRDEIRRLLADNHHLIDENVTLEREIAVAKEELHNLSHIIPQIRADKEAQARDLIQKGLKLEADLRSFEPVKAELLQLQSEAQKLHDLRLELTGKLQALSQDLKHARVENEQIPTLKVEIDGLRQELVRARTAYEYEKKANAEQIEQRQSMEKNLVSMAREVEKLRAEHMSTEKRVRGPGGSYDVLKSNPDSAYTGVFGDGFSKEKGGFYGTGPWGSYDRGFPRH